MAANQISVSFYPVRWREHRIPDWTGLTEAEKPIQRIESVPVTNSDGCPLAPGDVKSWLTKQGFIPLEWGEGRVFERGQVHSISGMEKEIEITVCEATEEVTDVYCRFTLSCDRPPSLREWTGLVAELCKQFQLRLEPEGTAPCSAAEFELFVRDSIYYRQFASSFGWATVDT
jgi:hypothetical protein